MSRTIQPVPCPCCGSPVSVTYSVNIESSKLVFEPYRSPVPPAKTFPPATMHFQLGFEQLRVGNLERVGLFKNRLGELAHAKSDGSDWTILEWGGAMAGESGEACNFAKKLRRGDFGDNPREGELLLLEELADVVIYADLMAFHAHGNLGDAVRDKFNKKSDEIGCAVKI